MSQQYSASGSGSAQQQQQHQEDQVKPLLKGIFQGDWATDATVSFLAETYTVFSSLKMVVVDCSPGQIPSTQTMQRLARVAKLYRKSLSRHYEAIAAQDEERATHVAALNNALLLASTLYLPADGEGAGVVGEELLHWVNCNDPAPSTEEGESIAGAAVSHLHPRFWDYTLRCVIRGFHESASAMVETLTTHHSRTIVAVARSTCKLLRTLPIASKYSTESTFTSARRGWLAHVRALVARLEGDMDEAEAEMAEGGEAEAEDQRLEFEAQFRILLEVAAGVKERVFEACDDWKEALGAWGTLVQPGLRRDDVPATMSIILEQFPIDATLADEVFLCALVKGEVIEACQALATYDAWLAAHLIDLFDKAALLLTHDAAAFSASSSLRNKAVLQYAETLLDDSGLWNMSIDYLASAGPAGFARMRNVVLAVPLSKSASSAPPTRIKTLEEIEREAREAEMDTDADDADEAQARREREKAKLQDAKDAGAGNENIEEVLKACMKYGLEEEARAICKYMAQSMASQRRYGVALAYCVRASDARQIRRIADALLDEYVVYGAQEFVRMVDDIPAPLLMPIARAPERFSRALKRERTRSGSADVDVDEMEEDEERQVDDEEEEEEQREFGAGKTMHSSPLAFLARYGDFHDLYAKGELRAAAEMLVLLLSSGIAPERFWAVLVFDAIPLIEANENYFTNDEIFELLRIVEQIASAASAHAQEAKHYLGYLERILSASSAAAGAGAGAGGGAKGKGKQNGAVNGGGEGEIDAKVALKRLDVARLGLARAVASAAL